MSEEAVQAAEEAPTSENAAETDEIHYQAVEKEGVDL